MIVTKQFFSIQKICLFLFGKCFEKSKLSHRYVAAVEADKGNYNKAIQMLDHGLKTNKLDIDMLVNRAGYLSCVGDLEKAIKDYDLCVAHRPDIFEGWKYRGNIRFAQGKVQEAIEDYKTVTEKEPSDIFTWNNLGIGYLCFGKFAEAKTCFELVPQLKSGDSVLSTIQDNLTLCHYLENVNHNAISEENLDEIVEWTRKSGSVLLDRMFETELEKDMKLTFQKYVYAYFKSTMSPTQNKTYEK